jgi:hypothetical protein
MLPLILIFLVANGFLLKMFQSEQIKKQRDVATIPGHHKAQYSGTRDAISIHGYDVTHSSFRHIGWWNGSNLVVSLAGTQNAQNEQAETKGLQLCYRLIAKVQQVTVKETLHNDTIWPLYRVG